MTIAVGDRLPAATFRTPSEEGPRNVTADDIFRGKRVVLFAVPGAFTPACSARHLPGFLDHGQAIRDKGIDTIAVVAVNDVFVMDAWAKSNSAEDRVLFLSDGNAAFTLGVGLDMDMSGGGMGIRSRRYAMLVEDGVVKALNVEDSPGSVEKSSAEALLPLL